jgi:hypothetical protein
MPERQPADTSVRARSRVQDRLRRRKVELLEDRVYTANESFWKDALNGLHFPTAYIVLDGFNLTEWLPFAPGRYYTNEAEEQRKMAANLIDPQRDEYVPMGKASMVRGGIGTIRLREKTVADRTLYFLGASSSGVAHQGVPVALTDSQYADVMPCIKEHGGCKVKLVGRLQSLTEEMPSLLYVQSVPKYCFVTEDIVIRSVPKQGDLLATVAIMFTPKDNSGSHTRPTRKRGDKPLDKSWTFCSFEPSGSMKPVLGAATWLMEYASRYSQSQPCILTDFDEHVDLFPCPIEFPLSQITKGKIDWETLRTYGGETTNIKNYIERLKIMGDRINVKGSGNTIVNHSTVQNAFNKVKSEYGEATGRALRSVEQAINESGNKDAAENFESFNEELQKPEPKKSLLKTMWQGTLAALPTLKELPDVVHQITKLFT